MRDARTHSHQDNPPDVINDGPHDCDSTWCRSGLLSIDGETPPSGVENLELIDRPLERKPLLLDPFATYNTWNSDLRTIAAAPRGKAAGDEDEATEITPTPSPNANGKAAGDEDEATEITPTPSPNENGKATSKKGKAAAKTPTPPPNANGKATSKKGKAAAKTHTPPPNSNGKATSKKGKAAAKTPAPPPNANGKATSKKGKAAAKTHTLPPNANGKATSKKGKAAAKTPISPPNANGKAGSDNPLRLPVNGQIVDKSAASAANKPVGASSDSQSAGMAHKPVGASSDSQSAGMAHPMPVPSNDYLTQPSKNDVAPTPLISYVRRLATSMYHELVLEYGLVTAVKLEQDDSKLSTFRLHIQPEQLTSKSDKKAYFFTLSQPVILALSEDERLFTYIFKYETCAVTDMEILHLRLYRWAPSTKLYIASLLHPKVVLCTAQENRIFRAMQTICDTGAFSQLLLKATLPNPNPPADDLIIEDFGKLNESQEAAYAYFHANRISLIKGPPGTGKTAVIVEIIKRTVKLETGCPVLCTAGSNVAVDNIAERLLGDPTVRPVRICAGARIEQYPDEHPLAPICLHTHILKQLPPQYQKLYLLWAKGDVDNDSPGFHEMVLIANRVSYDIVSDANVLLATNISAGNRSIRKLPEVPTVIMDEATQATEASTLVPLALAGIQKLVLVGDEKQLPPFALSRNPKTSLFNRVVTRSPAEDLQFLKIQYRMHPAICEFPNMQFYDNRLRNGVTPEDRSWLGVQEPVVFIDIPSSAERRGQAAASQDMSWCNLAEADFVCATLRKLVSKKHVPPSQIGVITPYVAQRDAIASRLARDTTLAAHVTMHEVADPDSKQLMVASVDAFQGHERAFIIFSCVRSNSDGQLGFVSDRRRMNVALTRARNGLIVVGHADTLAKGSKIWRAYITYLRSRDLVRTSLAGY
ncbi:AGR108Cp [Eremothecium gossypii ATCC 10895]|uniref:AGR108Cp n=1 Tax=Eremothecium gossypii (strain ATCC 10895 / CBS 109.51 / FGSC 9923 / NRRL Y-1056) TaxID=284811 RepID=Q74ZU0_EREGS|nr:AGR108Cp [Eremothecium gossypii ATCC 10895]AAS54598.2 AGR108Cp [Eremothecium gossypii ATCC 10895]AEY98929.1 FAGR108Cp [Eremothecium gossypii FDAG1]